LKLLARLKAHRLAGRNADFRARARVAADTGLAGLHVEDAEPAQLYAVALCQSIFHGFEDRLDGELSLRLGDSRAPHDLIDDVELDHANLLRNGDFILRNGVRRCQANSPVLSCVALYAAGRRFTLRPVNESN